MLTKKLVIFSICLVLAMLFTGDVASQDVTPSPASSRLLLNTHAAIADHNDIFYIDPESAELHRLVHLDDSERPDRAFWSPNGKSIAVVINPIGGDTSRICIYAADGQQIQCLGVRLWGRGLSLYFPISWASDGKSILVLLEADDETPQLGYIDLSENKVVVTYQLQVSGDDLYRAYWSPTGRYLAYQAGAKQLPSFDMQASLYLVDTQNGEERFLTDESIDYCVAWLTDGSLGVAQDHVLNVFDVAGNIVSQLHPQYEGKDVLACPFAWSHNDNSLAFMGYFGTGSRGIFVTSTKDNQTSLLVEASYGLYTIAWSPDDAYIAMDTVYSAFGDVRVISRSGEARTYQSEGIPLTGAAWQPLGGTANEPHN